MYLVKSFRFLIYFFIFLYSFCSFSGIIEGVFVPDNKINFRLYGSDKYRAARLIGEPTFKFFNNGVKCTCYYKMFMPTNSKYKIRRHCVCFFFSHEGVFVHCRPF